MKFKILSIDGGGIKGLYSSTILEHLEAKYGGSCSDYFDMVCGTSTGGLIALGLSLKIPAVEISKIYSEHGSKIFPKRNKFVSLLRQTIWKGKFSDEPLKRSLTDIFGERVIAESNNLLCIPSYSFTDARPWIFKYDHKEGGLTRDNKAKYVSVALATSAAPTYLPLVEIDFYDHKQFIDGGVWANNPSLIALIEALTYFVGVGKAYDGIQILSVSSLNNIAGKPIGLKRNRSFIQWGGDLYETSMIGQCSFTHYFLSKLHDLNGIPIEYVRIPSETISAEQLRLVQLDVATPDAIRLIRGKGNDRGTIASKDPAIAIFFQSQKTYKIN
jgi:Txe/YoeB family toxin of Txe-Axe toxin-antitoxin module